MSDLYTDTYKTIENASEEILYKEKNSKFYGYAFPVTNEDEVKEHLTQLKKKAPRSETLVLRFSNWYRKHISQS